MRGMRSSLIVGVAAVVGLASARLTLPAQDAADPAVARAKGGPGEPQAAGAGTSASVSDALERPFPIPFGQPTRLDEVCRHLGRALRAPVVLDRAALDRLDLQDDDTVQLELQG